MVQVIGRIYKIVSSECDGCYIGSTTLQLSRRLSVHKCHYRAHLAGYGSYYTSFEVIKFADASIELIHEGVFDSKKDLEHLEGEMIRTTPNAVNERVAGRTKQEWRKTKHNCPTCGGKYTNLGKAQHLRTKKHQNAVSSASSVIDSSDENSDFS
jgi:hypothetical protein